MRQDLMVGSGHDNVDDTKKGSDGTVWTFPDGFHIEESWFDHKSQIHGKSHTLRVMILADTLYKRALKEGVIRSHAQGEADRHEDPNTSDKSSAPDHCSASVRTSSSAQDTTCASSEASISSEASVLYRDLMAAALIHDLARRHDGYCTEHGSWAAKTKRAIAEKFLLGFRLSDEEWASIAGAVAAHSRSDPPARYMPGSLTALLKDADGLDRVRLYEAPDPKYFRHSFTADYIDFAWELLATPVPELERMLTKLGGQA
jgi:hypothetical protein